MPRLLIVEDEPVIRQGLRLLLIRRGYEVVLAATGSEAEHLVQESRFDCLIIDYRLSDIRGDIVYEFAVMAQPHLRERALFLTGDISEGARAAIEETCCPLLLKPFDIPDLLLAVARLSDAPPGPADVTTSQA